MDIIRTLAEELGIRYDQAESAVMMLDSGDTVPFIARYRKERTGALDDTQLRKLSQRLEYLRRLDDRRQEIISSLENQGKLTAELRSAIDAASGVTELEDIYRPFRPKRRTRASDARERGLEDLALILLMQQERYDRPLDEIAADFISGEKGVPDAAAALSGACDIIAEEISENAGFRKVLRSIVWDSGYIHVKKSGEGSPVYAMYDDYSEAIKTIAPHRVLAIDRGEREKALKVSVEIDDELPLSWLIPRAVPSRESPAKKYVERAAFDSWARLIRPSLEREIRTALTDKASGGAIGVFAENLRGLLKSAPLKDMTVLGFDPGYGHGCKLAVVDPTGRVLDTGVIYPHKPQQRTEEAEKTLKALIEKHRVGVVAIGNGTASRESEEFVAGVLRAVPGDVRYCIVSEAGASVWSASDDAAKEFPDMDVTRRSAVSIARRLQDPLAELVKIDPKAIGVGQYQHDLPQSELETALDGVVEDVVNEVGVDLNTASYQLLSHVSGLSAGVAKNIVSRRDREGKFTARWQLLDVPRVGERTYEQCAGFLRVPESDEILDNTGVHPESYAAAKKLLKMFGYTAADVRGGRLFELRKKIIAAGESDVAKSLGIGLMTLSDIVGELEKPGRDIRDSLPPPVLRRGALDISELKNGDELDGTVRNVTDFGAFIDIGVHHDGLLHVSKYRGDKPKVGQNLKVRVISVEPERGRIGLERA